MSKIITAVILDGFHKGHVVRMEYMPTVRLLKPRNLTVDYCCDGDITVNTPIAEDVQYRECFRGVDQDVVLYSMEGKSHDFISWFKKEATSNPWNEYTTLYFGYHNEPVRRKEDGTQMTEYDRGYERGVEDGRIIEARSRQII
jgi:hypothetical protein